MTTDDIIYVSRERRLIFTHGEAQLFLGEDVMKWPTWAVESARLRNLGDALAMFFERSEQGHIDTAIPQDLWHLYNTPRTRGRYVWSYLEDTTAGRPLHVYEEAECRGWTFAPKARRLLIG